MDRKEFLGKIGIGAAIVLTSSCLGSCGSDSGSNGAETDVDFTIDLTSSTYTNLANAGGFVVIENKYVVARTSDLKYVAATRVCSHENQRRVEFKNGEWYCTDHGARFGVDGNGLNGNGSKGLTIYKTELDGTTLRIYS